MPLFLSKESNLRISISPVVSALSLILIIFLTGCVDALEPAGPAQYENPDYPSEYTGYSLIPAQFKDGFMHQGRVYITDRTSQMIISFSASDPNLEIPEESVEMDTLFLGFPPGKSCFDRYSETLYISSDISNDIYRLPLNSTEPPELLYECESIVTRMFTVNNGNSLLICFLGTEWLVRSINSVTGQVENEYETGWPVSRAALSVDETRLLVNNSGRKYLIEIDAITLQKLDSIPVPERISPFLYNTSGNIVVFNQYTIHPRVYLIDGETKAITDVIESVNPYKYCFLMPGTDVVLAPRRSDNRISVLNSENMIFAPSLFCFSYAEMVFSSPDNDFIIVMCDSPGRAYVFENSI